MTNMEFYRTEIEKLTSRGLTIAIKKDGTVVECTSGHLCDECIFNRGEEYCTDVSTIKWLMSEHEDKPTITAREWHFLKFIQTGWLVRDTSDGAWWFRKRPQKTETMWNATSRCQYITELADGAFPFIKWEDEEPWSVEELLKLEVVG